jgi:beta-1,4-mannosyltransferase
MPPSRRMRVCVVVLGDVGRSPRMQYHAFALASRLADVDLIGGAGSELRREVAEHPGVHVRLLAQRPPALPAGGRARFLAASFGGALRQGAALLRALLSAPRPDVILLQTPPAVPTLLVALAAARLRDARLVVDWHNFGYALLALRLGAESPVVRAARWYERALGVRADVHLCVSGAMRVKLEEWGIEGAVVVYDRSPEWFAPVPAQRRREVRLRLERNLGAAGRSPPSAAPAHERTALIVSPTSWTADEDFSLLLDAAARADVAIGRREARGGEPPFPGLLILLTGKGALRELYEARMARLQLRRVSLRTLWVSPQEYPLLLGSADLGLCLHRSASGVDLPMKIADMFGCGLPVCAFDYGPCLTEQVRHGENGLLFSSSEQLAEQLLELFDGFPGRTPLLDRLRGGAAASGAEHWTAHWSARAEPLLRSLAPAPDRPRIDPQVEP